MWRTDTKNIYIYVQYTYTHVVLDSPVVPFCPFLGEGTPTKID